MVKRCRDPENKYTHGFLREYHHWVLEVSYRQHTLGCCTIFCKNDASSISNLSPPAAVELTRVIKDMERALSLNNMFNPSTFDYYSFGHDLKCLNVQCIPRYRVPREFAGRVWVDAAWGGPVELILIDSSQDLVSLIRDEISGSLEN